MARAWIEIPLTKGYVAKVCICHGDLVRGQKWYAHKMSNTTYATPTARGRPRRSMHQVIVPGAPLVDHINHDGLDNRCSNLRPATSAQNNSHRRIRRDSTSGYRGVARASKGTRWQAQIGFEGRQYFLGTFATKEEAARAFDEAALRLFGPEHCGDLNFWKPTPS
jgi:hypothetical protein